MPSPIDTYLAALPADQRKALRDLRAIVHAAVPGADEAIKTRVPAIRYKGKTVVGFGAAKSHVALYVMFGDALTVLRREFARFDVSNRVVRFTPDRPLPATLVRKVVRHRVAEIEAEPASRSTRLPDSMRHGKASAAKAADGDAPALAYIAGLPQPQRGIAERVDAIAARTLPGLRRAVKWGIAYYGVGDGWCFCCGGFADHVKLMFINGAELSPVPPVTPVAMGKATRGVELRSAKDLDERQVAAWMRAIASKPGVGAKKR